MSLKQYEHCEQCDLLYYPIDPVFSPYLEVMFYSFNRFEIIYQ